MNKPQNCQEQRHVISIIVDNEFGVLARVVGLFSARGYNIESLSVAVSDIEKNLSRITIVTLGHQETVELIVKLLNRLVPVHTATSLNLSSSVERSLALIKVTSTGEKRIEALRIAQIFRANVVDSSAESFVFEIIGKNSKIEAFIEIMKPLGLVELCHSGTAALSRGKLDLITEVETANK